MVGESKSIQELSEEVGVNPGEVREVLRRANQHCVAAPGNRVIVHGLGTLRGVAKSERRFWRPDGKLYDAPARTVTTLTPPRQAATLVADHPTPFVTLRFVDFADGFPDYEASWQNGVRINSALIAACGTTFNRAAAVWPTPSLQHVEFKIRNILECGQSGQPPIWNRQNMTIVRHPHGWATENDRSDVCDGVEIVEASFDSDFGLDVMRLPLDPNGPRMNSRQAAYVHRVFDILRQ